MDEPSVPPKDATNTLKTLARHVADDQTWLAAGAVVGSVLGLVPYWVRGIDSWRSIGGIGGALAAVILKEIMDRAAHRSH